MEPTKASSAKQIKILIVEDEIALRRAMTLKLAQENYAIDNAENGREGLDMIIKNNYDLVLLDLMLPELDGFEVLKEMQAKGIKTKVLVLSNLSQEEDIDKVKKYGAVDYFVKSNIQLSELVNYIKTKLLHEHQKKGST
jgi:DNA-binding response OmpR family regulator